MLSRAGRGRSGPEKLDDGGSGLKTLDDGELVSEELEDEDQAQKKAG